VVWVGEDENVGLDLGFGIDAGRIHGVGFRVVRGYDSAGWSMSRRVIWPYASIRRSRRNGQ